MLAPRAAPLAGPHLAALARVPALVPVTPLALPVTLIELPVTPVALPVTLIELPVIVAARLASRPVLIAAALWGRPRGQAPSLLVAGGRHRPAAHTCVGLQP